MSFTPAFYILIFHLLFFTCVFWIWIFCTEPCNMCWWNPSQQLSSVKKMVASYCPQCVSADLPFAAAVTLLLPPVFLHLPACLLWFWCRTNVCFNLLCMLFMSLLLLCIFHTVNLHWYFVLYCICWSCIISLCFNIICQCYIRVSGMFLWTWILSLFFIIVLNALKLWIYFFI